ncbi:MAG TPA: hypothetical protein VLH18_04370 [Candidatus Limnocylindrales bacterium]|nr:hypothetical protein [Candidatus Limnocylindrales bacterium]
MRWEVETAFDDLKNKLGIENFTGTKPILLEQDIYPTVYLCNIINDIVLEAQTELEQETNERSKHVMAINKNIAIGIMKDELIYFILEKNDRKRNACMNSIVNEIERNLLPVRKGRHFPRTKGQFAGKYASSRKRAINYFFLMRTAVGFIYRCMFENHLQKLILPKTKIAHN